MSGQEKEPWTSRAAEAKVKYDDEVWLWKRGGRETEPLRPMSAYFLWIGEVKDGVWKQTMSKLADEVAKLA